MPDMLNQDNIPAPSSQSQTSTGSLAKNLASGATTTNTGTVPLLTPSPDPIVDPRLAVAASFEKMDAEIDADSKLDTADTTFMTTPKNQSDLSQNVVSNEAYVNPTSNKVDNYLADYTQSKVGTTYGFGSKNSSTGSIDCSGWVAEDTLQAMQRINRENGNIYDMGAMHNIMSQGAAWQIASVAKVSGYISQDQIKSGNLPSGTLIGIQRAQVPGWAQGRPNGISHIVQVVDQGGKKFVSQSAGSVGGVNLTPYDEFMAKNQTSKLFATNPFQIVSSVHLANKQNDQGTGENHDMQYQKNATGIIGATAQQASDTKDDSSEGED